ncbi:hypothetical protein L7F22_001936 [Adiantum nelumboides]|nr:hypothetical protein [Adiantum nelumboides]
MASSDTHDHLPHPQPHDADNSALFQNYSMNGKIIISALGILFCMVFIIIVLHMYTKWCWRRRSNIQQRSVSHLHSSLSSTQLEPCKPSGLEQEVVEALPIFTYTSLVFRGANLGPPAKAAECAVCLAEFRQDETCKLLPKCRHFFHAACIDVWFLSHATCPLCRATPGLLLVDVEAGSPLDHHVDESRDEQCQEAQSGLQCKHSSRHHTTCGDDEQDSGDDGTRLNTAVSSQARKWRRSFSDKFPCTRKEAMPSRSSAHVALSMGELSLSQITNDNSTGQDSPVAFSSCSSLSSLVSPHRVSSHTRVCPPLLREPKALTRVFSK